MIWHPFPRTRKCTVTLQKLKVQFVYILQLLKWYLSTGDHAISKATRNQPHVWAIKKQLLHRWNPGWRVQGLYGNCKVRMHTKRDLKILTTRKKCEKTWLLHFYSETELEDLLTTYTKLNKNASVFLGGRPERHLQTTLVCTGEKKETGTPGGKYGDLLFGWCQKLPVQWL